MKKVLPLLIIIQSIVVYSACLGAGTNAEGGVNSLDFAKGYYIEIKKEGAIYSLNLPEDVYRTVRDSSFTDVAVFNGAGKPVAHDIDLATEDTTSEPAPLNIPMFPLLALSKSNRANDLLMRVERNPNGSIVSVLTSQNNSSPGQSYQSAVTGVPGMAYLLDLSGIEGQLNHLNLYWGENGHGVESATAQGKTQGGSSLHRINIFESNDLQRWTLLVSQATLADLSYGDNRIEKRKVELKRQPKQYLKVVPVSPQQPFSLQQVTGAMKMSLSSRNRRWVTLFEDKSNQKQPKEEQLFNSSYRLPIDTAQLRLPGENSFAAMEIWSRAEKDDTWRSRCKQDFYHLQVENAALNNEPCSFAPTDDTHWRITVPGKKTGQLLEKGGITLRLGWSPAELSFLSQGNGPFVLAYGSTKIANSGNPIQREDIKAGLPEKSLHQMEGKVRLGKRIELGGKMVLEPSLDKTVWKRWLLWGVLLAGVAILAVMVKKMVVEMQQQG